MKKIRRRFVTLVLALAMLAVPPAFGAQEALAAPSNPWECFVWYFGDQVDEELYYVACLNEDSGEWMSGWIVLD